MLQEVLSLTSSHMLPFYHAESTVGKKPYICQSIPCLDQDLSCFSLHLREVSMNLQNLLQGRDLDHPRDLYHHEDLTGGMHSYVLAWAMRNLLREENKFKFSVTLKYNVWVGPTEMASSFSHPSEEPQICLWGLYLRTII